MIAIPAAPEPPALEPPAIVAPAPREVSFGRIAGRLDAATRRIVVLVDGEQRAERAVRRPRFALRLALPTRDVTVSVVAYDADGNRASASVRPVFGLPRAALPRGVLGREDAALARRLRTLLRAFPGTSAVYVQSLSTGAGAAWNARARFPAASTLKLAIAIETLRVLPKTPAPRSRLGRLLRAMLVRSQNLAANRLLVWLGGSTASGGAAVTRTLRNVGIGNSVMYGGYVLGTAVRPRPIPIRVEAQPRFARGKYTTAWDLARLHRYLHLATAGRGPLVRLRGAFSARDARSLLFTLAHSADHGKLDRFVDPADVAVPHKAGWVKQARHDSGLVYWNGGVFVVAVMTWRQAGVGDAADILAGRIAKASLERFRALRARRASAVLLFAQPLS